MLNKNADHELFPRAKIAYRFATTPEATGVCSCCGRWTDEATFTGPCPCCGWGWVGRDTFPQAEVNAAAMVAIAGGCPPSAPCGCTFPVLNLTDPRACGDCGGRVAGVL
jgi:hypothetical protein